MSGRAMLIEATPRDRIRATAPVLAVHALLALLLLKGLQLTLGPAPPETLRLVDVPPEPPVPLVRLAPERSEGGRREGAAAPAAREARPSPLAAPEPVLPPPPDIRAAPVAGQDAAPASGARPVDGPGTGAGGIGTGTGSGRFGDGPGRGGDGGGDGTGYGDGDGVTPPRRISGRIRDRDYPRGAGDAGVGGMVSVIYTVEADGSATECRVTRSSGSRDLDLTTCRLIEQRFRFEPSRDRRGRPVRSRIVQDHYWEVEDLPPDPNPPPRRRRFRIF